MTRLNCDRNKPILPVLAWILLIALPATGFANTATVEDVKSIARLYSAAFDREPKIGGLNFWVDSYEDGRSLIAIASEFNGSPEFKTKYGSLSDRQFVEQLFRNVLGRDGAPSGIDFWGGKLSEGASRALVLAKFADSPENVKKTLDTFANMHFTNGQWSFVEISGTAYWKQLLQEIKSGEFTSDSQIYSLLPDLQNCDPGAVSEAAKLRAMEVLNQVRSLHGLTPVQYDSFYDPQVQSSSLVQRANNYLDHTPAQSDRCYTALADSGSSSSNLSLVGGGSQNVDPASDILGWTHDRNNVAELMAAGHRRWNLFPELGYISYGQVAGASAQKVFSFGMQPGDTRPPGLEFIAFPYQTYPYVLVEKRAMPTPWSLSIVPPGNDNSAFDYFSMVEVQVKDSATGRQLTVHSLYSDTQGFGLRNFLSWLVDGYEYDTEYLVEIKNIQMPGGETRTLKYYVYLEYFNIFTVSAPLEAGDSKNGNKLTGSFANDSDLDSYSVSLAGTTVFQGQSKFSNQAFYILLYDDRKRLLKSSDVAFEQDLDAGDYTVLLSLCDDDGICYQGVDSYAVTIN